MKYAGTTGASASISFNGTGIKLIMTKNSNLGIAGIYQDGVYSGTVDQYSPTVRCGPAVRRRAAERFSGLGGEVFSKLALKHIYG